MKRKLNLGLAGGTLAFDASSIVFGQTLLYDSSFISPALRDDRDPQAVRHVESLTIQPDGKMLAFGFFTDVGG